jgi:hypothetical protein
VEFVGDPRGFGCRGVARDLGAVAALNTAGVWPRSCPAGRAGRPACSPGGGLRANWRSPREHSALSPSSQRSRRPERRRSAAYDPRESSQRTRRHPAAQRLRLGSPSPHKTAVVPATIRRTAIGARVATRAERRPLRPASPRTRRTRQDRSPPQGSVGRFRTACFRALPPPGRHRAAANRLAAAALAREPSPRAGTSRLVLGLILEDHSLRPSLSL